MPLVDPAPVIAAAAPPVATSDQPATPDDEQASQDDRGTAHPVRTFRTALANLGMQAVPSVDDVAVAVAAGTAQACAAAVPVGVLAPSAAVSALAQREASHRHRADDEPPHARGPPAPLDAPSSPAATSAGTAAPAGAPSGAPTCAIDLVAIAVEPSGGEAVTAPQRRDHTAPAAANVAARAPPVA